MKYLVEYYIKSKRGIPGWKIVIEEVVASSDTEAARIVSSRPMFDCVIQVM